MSYRVRAVFARLAVGGEIDGLPDRARVEEWAVDAADEQQAQETAEEGAKLRAGERTIVCSVHVKEMPAS